MNVTVVTSYAKILFKANSIMITYVKKCFLIIVTLINREVKDTILSINLYDDFSGYIPDGMSICVCGHFATK